MTTFLQDVRVAVRRWRARPTFAVTAALTLALGIGSTTAVFTIVDAILLRPLPYPHADRLVAVWDTFPHWRQRGPSGRDDTWDRLPPSWPEYLDVRTRARTLDAVAMYGGHRTIVTHSIVEQASGAIVSANFFALLGARPTLGRTFVPEEEQPGSLVVVLSHAFWTRAFGGDPAIVGRSIRLDDTPHVVIGVLAPGFRFPKAPEYWLPFGAVNPDRADPGDHGFSIVARMRPGITMDDVLRDVEPILRGDEPSSRKGAAVAPLFDRAAARARPLLLIVFAAVGTLLLIACANVAGLLLGEAAWRRREIAVRAALGAGRARLLQQLLIESGALALLGGAAGVALAYAVTPLLEALAPAELVSLDVVSIDARVLVFTCTVMIGTVLLFGTGPALTLVRQADARHLKAGGRASTGPRRAQSLLVIGEIALTMTLLFAAGLLLTTLSKLGAVDPGFAREQVLTMRVLPPPADTRDAVRRRAFEDDVLSRVSALPGVRAAAWVGPLAFSGEGARNVIQIEGQVPVPDRPKPEAHTRVVTPAYFDVMRIPVLSGRAFSDADGASAPRVALVSRAFERRFAPRGSAIGMRFRWQQWWTVVGVVADTRHEGMETAAASAFYVPLAQAPPGRVQRLVVKTEPGASHVAAAATTAIRQVARDALIEQVDSMDRLIAKTLSDERYRATLMSTFALFASLLAAVGVYGTMARGVADRRREIGVRLALGARPGDVLSLVLRQGGRLVFGGLLLGLAGTIAGGRALRSMLFGVTWFDPVTLIAVAALLGGVGLMATWVPARRAARVNPMTVLRAE